MKWSEIEEKIHADPYEREGRVEQLEAEIDNLRKTVAKLIFILKRNKLLTQKQRNKIIDRYD